jgi:hypothetical protein
MVSIMSFVPDFSGVTRYIMKTISLYAVLEGVMDLFLFITILHS